jgi:transcriptional regulator with XRE-family HTH domain
MALASPKYKTLTKLVNEWSAQSGDLPPVTLRRICDWAICGGFPDGTFAFPTGQAIDLLELHRAMRIAIGVGAPINRDLATQLLQRAIVSKAGIKEYCERIGVDPPQSMSTLRSKFRISQPRHSGPPDCPNGAKNVGQLEARHSAIAFINTIKQLRKGRDYSQSKIAEQANERGFCYLAQAQLEADASGDPEIQRQLAALRHEWEGSKAATNASAGSALSEGNSELPSAENKKRGLGRPQGSGSWEIDDLELVKEMRKGITVGEFRSITAAAKAMLSKARGSGTEASKEQRLRKRYSELHPS